MSQKLDSQFLVGSFPPLVTPFHNEEVDYEEYGKLVATQSAAGSNGVVVTGTTGEPSSLTVRERIRLYEVAVEASGRGTLVIAATGTQSFAETKLLTMSAEAAGADGVMVVTPYYVKPPQRALVQFYKEVCKTTSLPVLGYHIPGRTGVRMEPETVEAVFYEADNFVGIKHSSYDLVWVTEVIARCGSDFRMLVGVEELSMPMLAIGACGLVNAAANVVPEMIKSLYSAVAVGHLQTARQLHYDMYPINSAVFWDTNPIAVKYMMFRLGLLSSYQVRPPLLPATEELQTRLRTLLEDMGLT